MYVTDTKGDGRQHEVITNGLATHYVGQAGDAHLKYGLPRETLRGFLTVSDWGKGAKAKRLCEALTAADWHWELVFDAAHGFRYRLAVWSRSLGQHDIMRRVTRAGAAELGDTG